jgi:GTP cyclohydrolase II
MQIVDAYPKAPSSLLAFERRALQNERATTELLHGRPLVIVIPGHEMPLLLVSPVETQGTDLFGWILSLARLHLTEPRLLLTAERLRVLGFDHASSARSMRMARPWTWEGAQILAGVRHGVANGALLEDPQAAGAAMEAAIRIAKQARLIPAFLTLQLPNELLTALRDDQLFVWDQATTHERPASEFPQLQRVSQARVPIAAHEDCQVVLFRERASNAEHLAVIVGEPRLDQPVPVRLHSSCVTGDLFGSLRCDCGDQLQQALDHLAQAGGVLVYLSQEGRGTGLANKLRAYRLQDEGLDTIEADQHLGFRGDERDYSVAAAMLRTLDISRITLLTNNPGKLFALRQCGIEVVERQALVAPVNRHNLRYLQTKSERGGHLYRGDALP